jgi:uncharacterized membrane protein
VQWIAVAEKAGENRYRVAYTAYIWVKRSTGKVEGPLEKVNTTVTVEGMKSELAAWQRLYGIGGGS